MLLKETTPLLRILVSFILAADVVAAASVLADASDIALAPIVLLVTASITMIVALPAYLVLRSYRRETWLSCLLVGFLVGSVVAGLVLLPTSGSQQIGQDVAVIDGVRTAAGWRMYAEAVLIAGAIGGGAGAVFWAALRLLDSDSRWPRLAGFPLTAGIGLAIAASGTILAIPGLTKDRSCHNPLRDGAQSAVSVLSFTVELAGGEWPRFQDVVDRFAAAEKWDVDQSNARDKAFMPARFISICTDAGTLIRFEGADTPRPGRASVLLFQPQGGSSWKEPAESMLTSIETSFPDRLRRGWSDTEPQTPSTLLPN